jgi:cell division protease FtsH
MEEEDRRVTAYHEAGHALVAALIPQGRDVDPVHKVTIIPRGRALGVTMQLPEEDRLNASREWAENKIAISMGGRAAEELIFKQITSGASQDLEHATDLARKMVCECGMSPRLGPVNYGGGGEDDPFLGRDYATGGRGYSEQTAVEIDEEIRNVIQREYDRAMTTLRDNIELLRESAEMLLEFEVLEGAELKMILRGEGDKVRWRRRHQESNQNQPRPPRKDFVPDEDEEDESSGSVVSNTWKPAPAGGGGGDS